MFASLLFYIMQWWGKERLIQVSRKEEESSNIQPQLTYSVDNFVCNSTYHGDVLHIVLRFIVYKSYIGDFYMSLEYNVGYTINSGGRGTLDILWGCLVTTFLCTYTIQKLQVVPWSTSKTIIFRKKAFWMLFTLFCPEYLTWISLQQWQRARRYKDVRKLGHKDWTIQHAFHVDMGGLKIKLESRQGTRRPEMIKRHDDILETGGAVEITIRLEDLILLLNTKLFILPRISTHELEERSKSDQFAQFITSCQVIYFGVRTLGRVISNLPISPLELSTMAFVSYAAFVEFFWWYKPLDMRSSTVITLGSERYAAFADIIPSLRLNTPEQDLAEKKDIKRWFNRFLKDDSVLKESVIHVVWIGSIFNGVHIAAWNYSFGSNLEGLLWKIASVGACGSIVITWLSSYTRPKSVGYAITILSIIFYVFCRMYLFIETFVSLCSGPAALYQSAAWQNYLPGS